MKKVLVFASKEELSVWSLQFMLTQEKPVNLTEDQKFYQSILDKCIKKVKPEKDALILEYSSSLNQINEDESLSCEDRILAIDLITNELELSFQELNTKAENDVIITFKKFQKVYLKKVEASEKKELSRKPYHISLDRNFQRVV